MRQRELQYTYKFAVVSYKQTKNKISFCDFKTYFEFMDFLLPFCFGLKFRLKIERFR